MAATTLEDVVRRFCLARIRMPIEGEEGLIEAVTTRTPVEQTFRLRVPHLQQIDSPPGSSPERPPKCLETSTHGWSPSRPIVAQVTIVLDYIVHYSVGSPGVSR